MKLPQWNKRFLTGTRGRIIALLRSGCSTVSELAEQLEITDNAVRSHLNILERDGLVQQTGQKMGFRKPFHKFELTAEAEHLFPKAYATILQQLLREFEQGDKNKEAKKALDNVAKSLAAQYGPAPNTSFTEKLETAQRTLNQLGGLAKVEKSSDNTVILRGNSCPLSEVCAHHQSACQMVQVMIEEMVQAPVREKCTRGPQPKCCFEVDGGKKRA